MSPLPIFPEGGGTSVHRLHGGRKINSEEWISWNSYSSFMKWNTLAVRQIFGMTKKLIWAQLKNKICKQSFCVPAYLHWWSEMNIDETWSISMFDKQQDFCGTLLEVNKIRQSFYLGRQETLCRDGLKCQQKFALTCLQGAREIAPR